MGYIKKIFSILTKKNKINFLFIVFLSIVKTFIEIIGIGLLIPILSIISNAEKKDQISNYFFFIEKKIANEKIIFLFFILFILIYLIKTIYVVFFNTYVSRYSQNLYVETAQRLLNKYLDNKYIFFTQNNSADLIKNIVSETNGFAVGTVGACITIFSNVFLFFGICILLFFYNYNSIFVIIILFIICGTIANLNRKKLSEWGNIRQIQSAKMIQRLNEVIGGIKEVFLYNKRDFFVTQIKTPLKNFSDSSIYKDSFTSITGPLIEFIAIFIFFVFFSYLNISSNMKFPELIVLFGIFAYSLLRLLPNLISVARSIQVLRFNFPAVDIIYNILIKSKAHKISKFLIIDSVKDISFKNVEFKYCEQKKPALKNINLKIKSGDKIAIVGDTGSGKSTLINLISGLIFPKKGEVFINSSRIFDFKNVKLNIGYVSQAVYISDDDIIFNISLSKDVSKNEISFIYQLLKNLNLNNFKNEKDIQKSLGERGSKLSGGQIQRIGIARALFRKPSLLILDEATNALDEKTEKKILNYLFKEFKDKIVIFCTHKKKLLKYCNKIIEVKNQKLNFIK